MKEAFICISYDGQYATNEILKYQCPNCLRIIEHPAISYCMPNLTCTCNYPYTIYQMEFIQKTCPIGYKKLKYRKILVEDDFGRTSENCYTIQIEK